MPLENNTKFPFGDKLFIGVVKFFDSNKGFGYLSSNNYGMESNARYKSKEQSFYIDKSSWQNEIAEKKLVIFQPAIIGGKDQAKNIRLVNLEEDKKLVMDYYAHNNFITFDEKIKQYSQRRYCRPHFKGYKVEQRKYCISSMAGVCRYNTINEFTEEFIKSGDFEHICKELNVLENSVGGEKAYNAQLRGNYKNKELEHKALHTMFASLTETQAEFVLSNHPSLQIVAPDSILLSKIDDLDEAWGLPVSVSRAIEEKEEQKELELAIISINEGLKNKTRSEIRSIQMAYSTKLNEDQKQIISKKLDELILEECEESIKTLDISINDQFLKGAENVCSDYNKLSLAAKEQFNTSLYETYSAKILEIVNSVSSYGWSDTRKQQVLQFVRNDEILAANDSTEITCTIKDLIINDYEKEFVSDNNSSLYNFNTYESIARSYFTDEEYNNMLQSIETKCLECSVFVIVKWFEYRDKPVPDVAIPSFLELRAEDIISHVNILHKFQNKNESLLSSIVDKLLQWDNYVFPYYDEYRSDFHNLSFAKEVKSIFGYQIMTMQFRRLKYKDRIALYCSMFIDVISAEELKEYLLHNDIQRDYSELLDTECAKNAILSIILEQDCSTSNGIITVIKWANRYIGGEPSGYYEHNDWYQKLNTLIQSISLSNNEYLKVVIWAMYFMSGGKIQLLKNVYHLFPVDLQIQVLKRLFCAMATKKIQPSLNWIEDSLGINDHDLSLPVLIVLKFLKLKIENPNAYMTDSVMLSLFAKREDYGNWYFVNRFLNNCNGRLYKTQNEERGFDDSYRHFSGLIEKKNINGSNVFCLVLTRKQISANNEETQYNNKLFEQVKEYITISFPEGSYQSTYSNGNLIYYFNESYELRLRVMADVYRIKVYDVNYNWHYDINENEEKFCCECRLSNKVDEDTHKPFMWCLNHACYHKYAHFHSSFEWKDYTVLDFMRILSIPTDYISQTGNVTVHGQYIIFSTYMQSFHEFLEHLKCRDCGKLMEPCDISNFARSTITEFHCVQSECKNRESVVYLNHCFNNKCNHIIDSRDSKQCPNGSYICSNCGACCSEKKYVERYERLQRTGGRIPPRLLTLIQAKAGHWEKGERFCYKCGTPMINGTCLNCQTSYNNQE